MPATVNTNSSCFTLDLVLWLVGSFGSFTQCQLLHHAVLYQQTTNWVCLYCSANKKAVWHCSLMRWGEQKDLIAMQCPWKEQVCHQARHQSSFRNMSPLTAILINLLSHDVCCWQSAVHSYLGKLLCYALCFMLYALDMPFSLWFWSQTCCQKTIPECFSRIVLLSTVSISEPIWQTGICLNTSNLSTFFCSDVKIRHSSPHHLFVCVSKICSALWLLEVSKITNDRVCDSILMHHYTKEPKVTYQWLLPLQTWGLRRNPHAPVPVMEALLPEVEDLSRLRCRFSYTTHLFHRLNACF